MSHDDGLHDKEAIPGQPEGVLLCDERRPLEPQDDGETPVCDQVKAVGAEKRREQEKQDDDGEENRKLQAKEKIAQRV
jgi:hypothetical protein